MGDTGAKRGGSVVVLAWAVLAVVVFAGAAPRVSLPGLYYDEAFMAQQARDFLEPARRTDHPSSVRQVWIGGRPIPLRNAVYLGSLKSQLLIPSFAVFGPGVDVLRLSTLAWSLLALLFTMLWARRLLGTAGAVLTGVLVATDATWLFFSLYEWGPFTTGLLCRAVGLYCLTAGWLDRRRGLLLVGGLALGLGVFNRADFVTIIAAAAIGLWVCRPGIIRELLVDRRPDAFAVVAGMAVGAAPMLLSLRDLFATSASAEIGNRGGLEEKLRVLWSVLDGSRFYRVIDWGGRFHRMWESPAPWNGFGIASALALAPLVADAVRRRRRGAEAGPGLFLIVTLALIVASLLVLPGAVRAHHLLNVSPFVHLAVAAAAIGLWRAAARGGRIGLAAGGVALAAAAPLPVLGTFDLIERTEGRGRWTHALNDVAREIRGDAGARVISLDWGFHEPLLFLTDEPTLRQPIWRIGQALRQRGSWTHVGRTGDLYLIHEGDYDLFGYGEPFLAGARTIEASNPDAVEIRAHADAEGALAFYAVRIRRPHRVVVQRDGVRIQLE